MLLSIALPLLPAVAIANRVVRLRGGPTLRSADALRAAASARG